MLILIGCFPENSSLTGNTSCVIIVIFAAGVATVATTIATTITLDLWKVFFQKYIEADAPEGKLDSTKAS